MGVADDDLLVDDGGYPDVEALEVEVEDHTSVEPRPFVALPLPGVDEVLEGNDSNGRSDIDDDPKSCAAIIDTVVEKHPLRLRWWTTIPHYHLKKSTPRASSK